jgi:hypothetical protein
VGEHIFNIFENNLKKIEKTRLDEAAESCTIDGESPVVESL